MNAKAGAILLWPALAIGLFSLLLWRWTGDLRLYFWVQFFPGLAVLLLFFLYSPKYTGTYYWIAAGVLYALAKVFEFTDEAIYSARRFVERTHAKAPCSRGRVLCHFAIFSDPPADPPEQSDALPGQRNWDRDASVAMPISDLSSHPSRRPMKAGPRSGG